MLLLAHVDERSISDPALNEESGLRSADSIVASVEAGTGADRQCSASQTFGDVASRHRSVRRRVECS